MSMAIVEYLERVGQMWDAELEHELVRVNAALETARSKEACRPFFARRRVVEAIREARKGSVERSIQEYKWIAAIEDKPDADESVLGIDAGTDSYCVVSWDGEAWGDVLTHDPRTVTHWMPLRGVLAPPADIGGVR